MKPLTRSLILCDCTFNDIANFNTFQQTYQINRRVYIFNTCSSSEQLILRSSHAHYTPSTCTYISNIASYTIDRIVFQLSENTNALFSNHVPGVLQSDPSPNNYSFDKSAEQLQTKTLLGNDVPFTLLCIVQVIVCMIILFKDLKRYFSDFMAKFCS